VSVVLLHFKNTWLYSVDCYSYLINTPSCIWSAVAASRYDKNENRFGWATLMRSRKRWNAACAHVVQFSCSDCFLSGGTAKDMRLSRELESFRNKTVKRMLNSTRWNPPRHCPPPAVSAPPSTERWWIPVCYTFTSIAGYLCQTLRPHTKKTVVYPVCGRDTELQKGDHHANLQNQNNIQARSTWIPTYNCTVCSTVKSLTETKVINRFGSCLAGRQLTTSPFYFMHTAKLLIAFRR